MSSADDTYTIYTRPEKWAIVLLASFAGLLSPFTANIYFPAIPTLVQDFHKSTELINLTVTLYMVLQGFSPMVFGSLADQIGRRLISLVCLLILCLSCVGLALVPTSAYWLLLLLRCIQAAGSASAIALGAGMIGDVSISAERAGYFGLYNLFTLLGPAIGPVIGGALAQHLGWRSIFWFLCIASALCGLTLFLFLPETLRSIAGNGSLHVPRICRPVIRLLGGTRYCSVPSSRKHVRFAFRNPLPLLKNIDILTLLVFNGVIYSVMYSVTASMSTLMQENYPFLTETTIGLCFLGVGGGQGCGSFFTGRLLDWEFQTIKKSWMSKSGKEQEPRRLADDETFPIERARLRTMPFFLIVYVAACVGYGWALQTKTSIAAALVLQFIIGYASTAVMNATQTLIIDFTPNQGSSVTACNNLIRCSLGAITVAVIDIMITRLGAGWTYVLLGGLCVLVSPAIFIVIKIGPRWRVKRREHEARRART